MNKSLYVKLVYIEFAKEIANNYRVLLDMIEYFFCIIFMFCSNANKNCNGVMRIKNGLRRLTLRNGDGD